MMLRLCVIRRTLCTNPVSELIINNRKFECDEFTSIRPNILEKLNRNLYLMKEHPLSFVRQRIVNYFHQNFKGRTGNSYFSVYDQLDPIVTTEQNFDSLLVPEDHDSRLKINTYYINKNMLLRGHMTAHQSELIKMGLNNFLMVGDVYRRDEIDVNHYPVFHQLDGVRLFTSEELFPNNEGSNVIQIINTGSNLQRTEDCQESYTVDASKKVEEDLKKTLEGLVKELFGKEIKYQWVNAFFPFTHPSWELEILVGDKWCEVLGCGIVEHAILKKAGCDYRIGWAFGLGLERLAMILYKIPDIRLFWSTDFGFQCQFLGKTFSDEIEFKAVSKYPSCSNHISFWLPEDYSSNDFYDLVREIGDEYVEFVHLIDKYYSKKHNLNSHCYEIVYRHHEKIFTQKEVNEIHKRIEDAAVSKLNVKLR